jgi:hypothetical protein
VSGAQRTLACVPPRPPPPLYGAAPDQGVIKDYDSVIGPNWTRSVLTKGTYETPLCLNYMLPAIFFHKCLNYTKPLPVSTILQSFYFSYYNCYNCSIYRKRKRKIHLATTKKERDFYNSSKHFSGIFHK